MLMTLGGLLTAHRFTDVTFGKTWPVLLIVYGLMKLLQRMIGPSNNEPLTPGMAGGQ
jgi:hypothetical protein